MHNKAHLHQKLTRISRIQVQVYYSGNYIGSYGQGGLIKVYFCSEKLYKPIIPTLLVS